MTIKDRIIDVVSSVLNFIIWFISLGFCIMCVMWAFVCEIPAMYDNKSYVFEAVLSEAELTNEGYCVYTLSGTDNKWTYELTDKYNTYLLYTKDKVGATVPCEIVYRDYKLFDRQSGYKLQLITDSSVEVNITDDSIVNDLIVSGALN